MLRRTLIILVVHALGRLTVDTDIVGGMTGAIGVGVAAAPAGEKALAAGLISAAGMLSSHHNVPLGTQSLLVVHTIFHSTL